MSTINVLGFANISIPKNIFIQLLEKKLKKESLVLHANSTVRYKVKKRSWLKIEIVYELKKHPCYLKKVSKVNENATFQKKKSSSRMCTSLKKHKNIEKN